MFCNLLAECESLFLREHWSAHIIPVVGGTTKSLIFPFFLSSFFPWTWPRHVKYFVSVSSFLFTALFCILSKVSTWAFLRGSQKTAPYSNTEQIRVSCASCKMQRDLSHVFVCNNYLLSTITSHRHFTRITLLLSSTVTKKNS